MKRPYTTAISIILAALLGAGFLWAEEGPVAGKPRPRGTGGEALEAAPQLKFDVEVKTGSGSAAGSPNEEPVPVPLSSASPPLPVEADGPEEPSAPSAEAAADDKRQAMFAALDKWHNESLKNYSYNIAALYDPFMPIREVRGRPDEGNVISEEEEANLPPILKLELSQLKLVAITTVSGREASSLASFEDGAGSSYILRQSDRIGRRKGRITRIEPTRVIVEEAPKGASNEPEITVMKLDVLDKGGLTYSD